MKPFESKIQDLVYNVDTGVGLRFIKVALYILFITFVMLLYTANQFRGLRDAEAMDYAQLGRNVMAHRQLITQHVRPASVWFLTTRRGESDPRLGAHPDIVHPPLYPVMLGVWFKITGANFDGMPEGPLQVFQPEYRILFLNHLFVLLTGMLVYLAGKRLFDGRLALLAVTLYFLSDIVWRNSLSGTAITVTGFWAMAAFYAMIVAAQRMQQEENSPVRNWIVPVALSLVAATLAVLTRYAAVALIPGLALYLGWARGRSGGRVALLFVVGFLLAVSPWIVRNIAVSGAPLGMAPHLALSETSAFPDNALERSLAPNFSGIGMGNALLAKWLSNVSRTYRQGFPSVGDGILLSFFLVAFFYRFVRKPVSKLRWGVALSMLTLFFIAGFYGDSAFRLAAIFWPFVLLYGLAFFSILRDRLKFQFNLLNTALTSVVGLLTALPLIFTLLPPRATPPYPPYAPPLIAYTTRLLEPTELMCADVSWATAWYGGRTTMLLPLNIEQFYDIHDYIHPFSGLLFTPATRNLPFARTLRSPQYASWMPLLEGRLPSDFPLSQGIPMRNMEMIFLSNRPRWMEQR